MQGLSQLTALALLASPILTMASAVPTSTSEPCPGPSEPTPSCIKPNPKQWIPRNLTYPADPNAELERPTKWVPKIGQSWQIVLRGTVDEDIEPLIPNVDIWDIDVELTNNTLIEKIHKANKKVMCYFSAGSFEANRSDCNKFHEEDLGCQLKGWDDEWWLNTDNENVRNIIAERVKFAAQKGCDAIDPDNVDGYDNPENGLSLTPGHAKRLIQFLREEADKYNMALGLKNAGCIIDDVFDLVDFSVNEECAGLRTGECKTYREFTNPTKPGRSKKPVFNIEYGNEVAPGKYVIDEEFVAMVCNHTGPAEGNKNFSIVFKDHDNVDGWVEYCDRKIYNTTLKYRKGDDKLTALPL
ncbi:hypothetical protein VHEMI05566 [[Torrubiella] hemipterigena]|uniref:alpha-galactosidase n=1 Tax=[Torrubiella] hemipterigena TaxID=1531966 RepID=A0A0A1SYC6_9HYPO|nr:hypothetical protein VHEMI05566 [[Torrubiella] hemipterigena]